MKYFCFYFPVRLGVMICSVMSILEALVVLAYFLINDSDTLKERAREMQENIDDYSSNDVFNRFLEHFERCKNLAVDCNLIVSLNKTSTFADTKEFCLATISFNGGFIVVCLLDIVAALRVWRWLSVPYIVFDAVRLAGLVACHVIVMMIFKKKLNLGVLIAASCAGGFFILFLAYMWGCSIALFQMVGVVNSKEYKKMSSLGSPLPEKLQRNITISSIVSNIKPLQQNISQEKLIAEGEIFASDFSEYYRRQ